jgi:hypothetical protein
MGEEACCAVCAFAVVYSDQGDVACHKLPPQPLSTGYEYPKAIWPTVGAKDWCGSYLYMEEQKTSS